MRRIIKALALITAGIVGGETVGVDLVIVRAIGSLPEHDSLRTHQAISRFVEPIWPIHTILAAVFGLAVMPGERSLLKRALLAAGAALMGVVAVISKTWTVPINHRVADWNPDDPPAGWRDLHRDWARGHRRRTAAGMFGFIAYVLAAVLPDGSEGVGSREDA